MSVEAALHNAVQAAYTADTGTGGLNNSSSSARVLTWARMRDPNVGPDRTNNRPMVLSEVRAQTINAATDDNARCTLRLHVFTKRDEQFTPTDAVYDRINTVFIGTTLTDPDNIWFFTPAGNSTRIDGPQRSNELHDIIEILVLASSR